MRLDDALAAMLPEQLPELPAGYPSDGPMLGLVLVRQGEPARRTDCPRYRACLDEFSRVWSERRGGCPDACPGVPPPRPR